jgi:hypothetical protein
MATQLKDLVGARHLLMAPDTTINHPFDSSANGVIFTLDNTTYIVFEDPSDGHRSAARPLLSFEGAAYELGMPSPNYVREEVLCLHLDRGDGEYDRGECDILVMRSVLTGKEIFRVGTSNTDDYYPSFVCNWQPENLSVNQ